jgi:hypothetical protein
MTFFIGKGARFEIKEIGLGPWEPGDPKFCPLSMSNDYPRTCMEDHCIAYRKDIGCHMVPQQGASAWDTGVL